MNAYTSVSTLKLNAVSFPLIHSGHSHPSFEWLDDKLANPITLSASLSQVFGRIDICFISCLIGSFEYYMSVFIDYFLVLEHSLQQSIHERISP